MLTPEQLAARKNGIGGSDVAAICGFRDYKTGATAMDVFLEKTTDYQRCPDAEHNANIWWGNKNEPAIIDRFIYDYPQKFTTPETIYDKKIPLLFANLDALLEDGSILEAKNVGNQAAKKWGSVQFSDEIPDSYLLQVVHYAAIVNPPRSYIAAYFGGSDHRVYEYKRKPDLEEMIRERCVKFWNENVLKGIPPDAVVLEDQRKLWRTAIKESRIEAHGEIESKIIQLNTVKTQMKLFEEEEEKLKMDICGFMKDNETLTSANGNVLATWKNQTAKRFNQKDFQRDHGDLHKQYQYETSMRVLRVKEARAND